MSAVVNDLVEEQQGLQKQLSEAQCALEAARIQVRYYEIERQTYLKALPEARPLPILHAQALVTYHKEAFYEGFSAACAKHGIEEP